MNPILIDMPLPIRTPRLFIRDIRPGDGQALYEAKKESHKDLEPWMGWAQGGIDALSYEKDEALCRSKNADFIARKDLMMLVFEKETKTFVAATGFHNPDWHVPAFEIGYWVRSSKIGQGYATEITKALCRYAFDALGAKRVSISHAGGNTGSQRVIEKVGFEPEGVAKKSMQVGEHLYDTHNYAMLDKSNLPEISVRW